MTRVVSVAVRIVLAAAAGLVLSPVHAQHEASRFDGIVDVARRELQDSRTPGASVALVDGDKVVFSAGVGVADVESGSPVRFSS